MTPSPYRPGQRFTSDLEPELGLGTILSADTRSVTVLFTASDTTRRYAAVEAPLRRARFQVGERLTGRAGEALVVAAVDERDGLLVYRGASGRELPETALSDRLSHASPLERLLAGGATDPQALFDLRLALLEARKRTLGSPARGFVGGRVDLIPHQLYIAREVTRRVAPRVLLADEVGLGKTIEACLILHHLLVSGRIERALVLVPESLLHQWLVELKRRFALRFSLYDEERCAAYEQGQPGENPFLDEQLVLASTRFLTRSPARLAQASAAGWDVLVVDEAHHLGWEPRTGPSPEYTMVETLAASATGLLLLTATPEQLGLPGHFARLRLLDPDRYPDLERFVAETTRYREVASIARALSAGQALAESAETRLRELFADDSPAFHALLAAARTDPEPRKALLEALVDRHGTGRVVLRNTRAAMPDFPERRVELAHLPRPAGSAFARALDPGYRGKPDLTRDPRVAWLVELLETGEAPAADTKVLLICHSRDTAVALEEELRARTRVRTVLFHEGLTLVQRDRNAAWFADPRGARLLIASEIGSEGRNFQFAQHLVLFDLPLDPDLVEQRIGRLDRIGQTGTIHIHVPWIEGTAHEVLVAWHARALDDLGRSLRGGHRLLELFGPRVRALASGFRGDTGEQHELEALVAEVHDARLGLDRELEESRDHLLEWSSFRPSEASALVADIRAAEADPTFVGLTLRLLEHHGIYAEELAPHTFRLNAEELQSDDFPELGRGDTVVTFDRARALLREDILFLTSDHPLYVRAADLFLGSTSGTTAATCPPSASASTSPRTAPLTLKALFVLECIAPRGLEVDRYLPATPLLVSVDAEPGAVVEGTGRPLLASLVERAHALAEERASRIRKDGLDTARALLRAEGERLRALERVNRSVRRDEIAHVELKLDLVSTAIEEARLRLDALCLDSAG